MIKKLQHKFVLIAMGSLLAILLVILGAANGVNMYQIDRDTNALLAVLSENSGRFPTLGKPWDKGPPHGPRPDFDFRMTEETPFETRYFWVKADANGTIGQIDTGHVAAISSAQAQEYGQQILSGNKASGYIGAYKYLKTQQEGGSLIVFVDCSSRIAAGLSFLLISCGVALISLLGMFFLVAVFSKRAIRPIVESMEKQKRFITDAGHEIKTPLAIISANTDVLELELGENEWVDSIRNQIKRLSALLKNMLTLSKMDEDRIALVFSNFSASDAVYDTALPFETLAETQGKQLELSIQPNLTLYGDEAGIRQLVSIIVENAVKYADDRGEIKISLTGRDKAVRLEVSNTCAALPEGDLNRLFGRFYRADDSRDRQTGGYGIGLSVAKAIVAAHKGKIYAKRESGNVICFIAIL